MDSWWYNINSSSPDVYDFPNIIDMGFQYLSFLWKWCAKTHLASKRGMSDIHMAGTFLLLAVQIMLLGVWYNKHKNHEI